MAERSFIKEVESLKLGEGDEFRGEGILAVTKALLQSGVSYVGGYQGAPVSHIMDVFSDAAEILEDLDIRFESSASEASACAMMAASVNYPLRGAVAWKSVVGTNVASDALANISSGGVTGGCLIIIGEDYGEGSSIMQERTHAFAMKSQVWLLDPRPNLPKIVDMVEKSFELSEASNTPVMLELRIRACHMHGRFRTKGNRRPSFRRSDAVASPIRDVSRITLPPANFLHEVEKVEKRWPSAQDYIKSNRLNEWFGPERFPVGIIVQGGLYNSLIRAMERIKASDIYGDTKLPIYCLNVTYPLVDDEIVRFAKDKQAILVIEEGQPEFIEHNIVSILHRANIQAKVVGKQMLPLAGEYTSEVIVSGLKRFLDFYAPALLPASPSRSESIIENKRAQDADLLSTVPARPAGFCTGCPERPIFTAMKLAEREIGKFHVSCDIGCHIFSSLPPFNIGNTTMGYGLGYAGSSAFSNKEARRAVAVMGDGGFWHNGLVSGVSNAVFNKQDGVLVVVDNNYAAGTGGQDVPSSRTSDGNRQANNDIEKAIRGVGASWIKKVTRTYDIAAMKDAFKQAMTSSFTGPKVVIAQSECMLNRQRRERPLFQNAVKAGERRVRERFGIDPDTCTGDHSCIRLSGCPSLTIKPTSDPLRKDPIAHVDNSCVGCGLCGEISHAAILCPSFYKATLLYNETLVDKWRQKLRDIIIMPLQRRAEKRLSARAF